MKPLCDFWFSSVLRTYVLLWPHDTLDHGSLSSEPRQGLTCDTLQCRTWHHGKWLVPLACPQVRVNNPFLQSAFASQQWDVSSITTLIISARVSSSILNSLILSKSNWASTQERVVAITARWNMINGMNESVPCRLTCDPSGLNDCVNINTGILYSQVNMCNPIQFNIVLTFSPHLNSATKT